MTSTAQVSDVDRSEVSLIVGSGFKIGVITTVGVTAFALISRPIDGMAETVVQSVLILVGMVLFSYLPANFVRVRTIDGVGWAMLVGLLGALFFTVFDTVILRPVDLYHWTWDAIGGGSGFWYVPVWWMGSTYLAGVGGAITKLRSDGETGASLVGLGLRTSVIALVIFAIIAAVGILPAASPVVALGFALGLAVDLAITAQQNK